MTHLDLLDDNLDSIRSEKGRLDFAREEGILEGKIAMAKRFLKFLDIETVAQAADLDIEVVKKLKSE